MVPGSVRGTWCRPVHGEEEGTGLHHVPLTLPGTMLTLKLKFSIRCLRRRSKSIRDKVDGDFSAEGSPHLRDLLRDKPSAVWAETLVVEVEMEAEGDWEEEQEEGETHSGGGGGGADGRAETLEEEQGLECPH